MATQWLPLEKPKDGGAVAQPSPQMMPHLPQHFFFFFALMGIEIRTVVFGSFQNELRKRLKTKKFTEMPGKVR